MTPQEIRNAIAASPHLQALAVNKAYGPIALVLSVGRTKIVRHFASERGVLERFLDGPLAADALLTKLEIFSVSGHMLASIVKRALKFLAQSEGLDIGSPATQGLIDMLLADGVITKAERDGLRFMATAPEVITDAQVEQALQGI